VRTLRRALHYMSPYWGWQSAALACQPIVAASSFGWPWVTKLLIDKLLRPEAANG